MTCVGLENAFLNEAVVDSKTVWPEHSDVSEFGG